MVKGKFQEYFPIKGTSCTYSCLYCRAHLARHEDLISKSFQGSQGRAYLFNQIVNAEYSEAKQRVLLTGVHFVADVYCACCQTMLGWKYERAFEASQRYKEGKVIVELAHLIKDNCWDTEWLSPHHRSPFSASCTLPPVQAQRKPPLVLSARNDSGIFSSPELSISLGLLSSPINREAFSLPFEFSVHLSSSSAPSQPFQSLFGPHPVSVQNSFHPTDPVVTSCHSLYRPPVVPSRVANSTTFPDQPTGSSDVGVCDDRVPNQSPTSPSQIGIKMWSQTDPYCTTTTACDVSLYEWICSNRDSCVLRLILVHHRTPVQGTSSIVYPPTGHLPQGSTHVVGAYLKIVFLISVCT
ncbi:unnamed protein product [Dicrocoelium dendriticum]|nr:unnamed protein product [Dicrocoelium dendriticum]